MNFNRLILAVAASGLFAGAAQASRNPTPPPSGIVVHLFGPNSIMSNITPDLPGETARPAPAQPGSVAPGAAPQGGGQVAATATGAPQADTDTEEPTVHDILHQMFVVGDPNHPIQPSQGRVSERPPVN